MRKRTLLPALALAVLLSPACQPAPAALTDEDRAAMEQVTARAMEIANGSKDWAEYARNYYTEDAVFMPPQAPAVEGHEAITASFEAMPDFSDLVLEMVEAHGTVDLAWARGTYTITWMMPDGTPMRDAGSYLEIWQRQADGSWKVKADMFNSDLQVSM